MGDKKKRGKRAANNAGDGFPIPHPDAIEIKTVPEQIIKLLALHVDKGGAAGGETRPLRCSRFRFKAPSQRELARRSRD